MISRLPKHALALLASLLMVAGILATTAPRAAQAANPPPVQTYYLSLRAEETLEILDSINTQASTPVTSYTSIAIGADDTLIYYDHWENGFIVDIANPASGEIYSAGNQGGVQIWGDGITSNGAAPGFPDDLLDAGDVIVLNNPIPIPRVATEIRYDGGDKFAATRTVAVVRSEWADDSDTLLSSAHEVYPTNQWGTSYTAPVGCNTSGSNNMFEYTALLVMAEQDGTVIQIDADANGTYEKTITLNKGRNHLEADTARDGCDYVRQGANVRSTDSAKPIQAHLFIGDIGSNFELRDITLVPDGKMAAEYYNPVGFISQPGGGTTSGPARMWLYNPNASTMYVRCELTTGDQDRTIAAKGVATVDVPTSSGANCYAVQSAGSDTKVDTKFTGLVTMDTAKAVNGTDGQAWDWSATLLPLDQLSNAALVGLGLGRDPTSNVNPAENGNPIWVTPVCNTYFYVDWNHDGTPDPVDTNGDGVGETNSQNGISVNKLQSVRLFRPRPTGTPADQIIDQTGAFIYTKTVANNGGVGGCNFASAWGQYPPEATAAAPGLDVGTTVLPVVPVEMGKSYTLIDDVDGDGMAGPGDKIEYLITITNIGLNPLNNVYVYDQVPVHTKYVPNTTQKNTSGNGSGSWASIPDNGTGTPFPLDVTGGVLLGNIPSKQFFQVRFQVTLDEITSPTNDYDVVTNCAVVYVGGLELSACVDTPVDNVPVIEVDKTANPTTVYAPGGPVLFTVKITNTGPIGVIIDSLNDDKFGNLDGQGSCDVTPPVSLAVGASYTCTFTGNVTGTAGTTHTNIVTAEGEGVNGDPVKDDDPADVTLITPPQPVIVVDKTADPTTVFAPGGDVTFTVKVTNTGPTKVTINSLIDNKFGDIAANDNQLIKSTTCEVPFTLESADPDKSKTCTFTAKVTGAAGDTHTNTVTAKGKDQYGTTVEDNDPADVTIVAPPQPVIVVDKTANPTTVFAPGGDVTFTVKVTNTGPTKVTINSLIDNKFGDISDKDNELIKSTTCPVMYELASTDPDAFFECTFTAYVGGNAGDKHTNVVTAKGEDENGTPVEDDDPAEVEILGIPTILVDKTANPTTVFAPGGDVTFTVKVTNTGPTDVTIDTLNDDVFGNIASDANTLIVSTTCEVPFNLASTNPDAIYTCTFTANVTGAAGDKHTNVVTAEGEDENNTPVKDDDPADVTIVALPQPVIVVDKTADPTTIFAPGGDVTFTVKVTNTGPTAVTIDTLDDDVFGNIASAANTLIKSTTCAVPFTLGSTDPDTTLVCTFTANVSGTAGTTHTNTVTAEGEDENGTPVEDDDPADVEIIAVPEIDVDKTANPTMVPEPGALVDFTVIVTNVGPTAVTIDSLVDDTFGDIADATNQLITSTTCAVPFDLAVSTPAAFYECTFTAFVGGSAGDTHTNLVIAEGEDENGTPVEGEDPADVEIVPTSKIGDTIWRDDDGDGQQDAGEPGIHGITVQLTPPQDVDLGNGPGQPITTVTDGNGNYLFDDLPPGTYTVTVLTPPPGMNNTGDPDGVNDSTSSVSLAPGEENLDQDFGYQPYIILTPSYLVTRVYEGMLTGEGSKACYWITLSAQPSDNVIIDVDPGKLLKEVKIDKSTITLTPTNWNNLTLTDQSNFLCVRAIHDSVDEPEVPVCGDRSAGLNSDVTPYTEECGDHKEFVEHKVSPLSPAGTGYNQSTPWVNETLTHLGRPAENYLEAMVVDDDKAEVLITESFAITHLDETGSPVGQACYWLTLGSQPLEPVTISIVPDGNEVTTDKTEVTLTATNWNTIDASLADKTNMVCVMPINDNVIDPPEVNCAHSASTMLGQPDPATEEICSAHMGSVSHTLSSADPNYATAPFRNINGPDFDGDQSTIDVLIRNDDVAALLFKPATLNLLEGTQATFAISLASRPTADVIVSNETTQLVFKPENWNVPQTVVVEAPAITGPASVTLFFQHTVKSADSYFDNLFSKPVEVTVIPEDGVLLSNTDILVSEAGQEAYYELTLTSQPKADVTVELMTDGQLAVEPAKLTFTTSNWNVARSVTVRAVNDNVVETATHQGRINHIVTSADSGYEGLAITDIIANISDDDVAAVVASEMTLAVSENGQQEATYDVVLNSKPTEKVVVRIDGGGQATTTPGWVVFTPDNWNTPQAVLVRAVNDEVDEGGAHTTTLTHKAESTDSYYNGYELNVPLTVTDDDEAGVILSKAVFSLARGETDTYTIVLTSRPTSAVIIDLAVTGGAMATNADCQDDDEGGAACVFFTPENWNVPQTVTIQASSAGQIDHVVTSADAFYQALNVNSVVVNWTYQLFLPLSRGN